MWIIQEFRLFVSSKHTARQLVNELFEIICPLFDETRNYVDLLSRGNGSVRFSRTSYVDEKFSDWCVSASVYNPQKCFDILGFVEKHKDIIIAFEAEGISKFKG